MQLERTVLELNLKAVIKTNHYRDVWRNFHSWDHIKEGLACYDTYFASSSQSLMVGSQIYLAWLLHDAFYIPGCNFNEEASAALATYYGGVLGYTENEIALVKKLIMQTKGHKALVAPHIPGSDIINDMDLHGMGDIETYWTNGEKVKREAFNFSCPGVLAYTSEFEKKYDKGRFGFLLSYYKVIPNLFKTEIGIELWQPVAEENLHRDIVECRKLLLNHGYNIPDLIEDIFGNSAFVMKRLNESVE